MTTQRVFFNFDITEDSHLLPAYRKRGGYQALEKTLKGLTPAEVQAEVAASGLRGRGGAGFPTATKWSFLAKGAPVYYLCCNADEGEPGTFKDRWIFENSPHLLIEGMLIASFALGVRHAFIYIRGEFDLSYRRLMHALKEAREAGLVGPSVMGSAFSCEIIVQQGAGAYVCGEESSMLSSIEGSKGYPKNKPPFPAVKGLFQMPTVINNVETLATIPWIVRNGGAEYAKIGAEKNTGTRLFGISGHVKRPGLYEQPTGYSLKEIIYKDAGGISGDRALKAVIPGGCSTPILTAAEIENVTLDIDSVAAAGSMLGSGGVIVIAEGTCMVRLLQVLTRFYAHESCGQCIPCREGTAWMNKIVTRIGQGNGAEGDMGRLEAITKGIMGNTVCALGAAASMPVASFLKKFPEEFDFFIKNGRSLNDGRLDLRI